MTKTNNVKDIKRIRCSSTWSITESFRHIAPVFQ